MWMARPRSANRDKAFEIYKENKANITIKEIAEKLDVKVSTVNSWKSYDKWDQCLFGHTSKPGAKKGNVNSLKGGKFVGDTTLIDRVTKYMPKKAANLIMETVGESMIEKLWRGILIQEAKMICEKDIDSEAMRTMARMINQYEDMIHKNWKLVTEEQKLRVEKLKAEVNLLNKDNINNNKANNPYEGLTEEQLLKIAGEDNG